MIVLRFNSNIRNQILPYKDRNFIINTIFFIIAIYDIVQNVKKSCFDLLHTSFTIQ